jgi:hypothetical protein
MPDLNVTVGADISAYQAGMDKMAQTATAATSDVTKSLGQMAQATEAAGGSAQSASMKFQQMRSGLSAVRDGAMGAFVGGQRADMMFMAMGHHFSSLINETGSVSKAFSALGSSLMGAGGVIIGLTLAYELFKKFSQGADEAKDATKDYADTLDSVRKAELQGQQNGTDEIVRLKLLYNATQDHTLSLKERNLAYDELNSKYPKFFSNADREKTLLGQNATAYDALAKAIMAAAAAKAYENQIGQNANRAFENDQKILDELKKQADLRKTISEERDKTELSTSGREGTGGGESLAEASATTELGESIKKVNDLRTDSKILIDQNGKLATLAMTNEIQAGFKTENEIDSKNKKLKEQKDGFALIEAEIEKMNKALEDALIAKDSPTVITKLSAEIDVLVAKLATLKQQFQDALNPHAGNILSASGAGSKRGTGSEFGNTVDNGGLAGNSGVNDFNAGTLGNAGLGNQDATVAAMKKGTEAFKEYRDAISETEAEERQFKKEQQDVNAIVTSFGPALMKSFESALSGTQSFASAMGQFLLQLVEKLVAAAAAAAVLDVLLTATGFGGVTSFGAIFGQLSGMKGLLGGTSGSSANIPGFATGGIFDKATIGMFGEAGKEAIVTPKHLADFAGVAAGGNSQPQTLTMKLQGSDMLLFLDRANKTKGRTS